MTHTLPILLYCITPHPQPNETSHSLLNTEYEILYTQCFHEVYFVRMCRSNCPCSRWSMN